VIADLVRAAFTTLLNAINDREVRARCERKQQRYASLNETHRARNNTGSTPYLNFTDRMPRQLPWVNKGAGSRTQVKQAPKGRANTRVPSDIDDDFFDGTVLASSGKGKGKAVPDVDDSDDDLPGLPAEPSTPRTKTKAKDALRKARARSSSPPPIQDHIEPEIEYMRTGVSKFDLRDDEWMMVEDEFLETAKLFTRHLHIAEYQKLKERIEATKKAQVEAVRPVVLDGKMSAEGSMKKKAEVQEKRQIKAIQDVFASQNDDDDDEEANVMTPRPTTSTAAPLYSNRASTTAIKRAPVPATTLDSDSDDLDARSTKRSTASKSTPASALSSSTSAGQKSALPAAQPTQAPASSFAKPALSTARQRAASRKSRATPFDMLDGYVSRAKASGTGSANETSPTRSRAITVTTTERAATSRAPVRSYSSPQATAAPKSSKTVGFSDDWGTSSSVSRATAERLAKKKAEREKLREGRKKGDSIDDVPTFLV
jgi:hypothetical protein